MAGSGNEKASSADFVSAKRDAQRAQRQAENLEAEIDRLLMITEALWLLLKKEHGYSDEVLANVIKEIDLRDGVVNGRLPKSAGAPCPHCGRTISIKLLQCLYCNQPLQPDPFAR